MNLTVQCPAKVNLFLSVGPPDGSGYHPVRTILQTIGLFDRLTITTRAEENQIRSNWQDLPQDNSIAKALRLAGEAVVIPPLDIFLEKEIPAGSGLGGGSSDAAGLLRALRRIAPGKIDARLEHDIAVAIGVDTPFFLVGGRARGEGYGEKLTPLPDASVEWLVIAMPPVPGPTAAAYVALDQVSRPFLDFPENDAFHNDFLAVAPQASHALIEQLLDLGAEDACLSGSGSAVFGCFANQSTAEGAASRIEGGRVWTVPTLSRAESLHD